MDTLIRSGLYQRHRNIVTTWHPLQEDFFAAKVLDLRIDEYGTPMILGAHDAPELATVWELLHELRPNDAVASGQ